MKNVMDQIKEITKYVRLPGVRRYLADEVKEANMKDLSYEDFLYNLLLKEYDLRVENSKKNRIRLAGFPYRKYLEELSIADLPPDARKRFKILKSLDFIENGQNVILAGSPGTGNYRKFRLWKEIRAYAYFSGNILLFLSITPHNKIIKNNLGGAIWKQN